MAIEVGTKLPEATLKQITADGPAEVTTDDLFSGKKVVLFGLPGAFTGTCTLNHAPGYIDNRDEIMAKGVDTIAVVAVNDHFVMQAWAEHMGGMGKIEFLSDWDGAFARSIGMDLDLAGAGLGLRSNRYSMIVEDGTVTTLNVEENPGEAVTSGAAHLMGQLD